MTYELRGSSPGELHYEVTVPLREKINEAVEADSRPRRPQRHVGRVGNQEVAKRSRHREASSSTLPARIRGAGVRRARLPSADRCPRAPSRPDSRELTLGAALFRVLVDDNPASDNSAGNISCTYPRKSARPASARSMITAILFLPGLAPFLHSHQWVSRQGVIMTGRSLVSTAIGFLLAFAVVGQAAPDAGS